MSVEGFNYDNVLIRALSRLGDVLILSLLWTVCSIPIITIGASTTALYYTAMKGITEGEGYVAKRFFKSFKANFLQSTFAWLILAFVGFVLSFDVYYWVKVWTNSRIGYVKPIIVVSVILLTLYVLILLFTFPILAKFDNKLLPTFRNALLISVKNFHTVIIMIVVLAICAFFVYLSVPLLIAYAAFGFGLLGYFFAWLMLKAFKPFQASDE